MKNGVGVRMTAPKLIERTLSSSEMAVNIAEWIYCDSCVQLSLAKLESAIVADASANGGRYLTDNECMALVCGGDDGTIPEALSGAFPTLNALLIKELT